MTTTTDGRAQKTRTTFRLECGVSIEIHAPPKKVWSLLTTAPEFPKWNSTVESIEGTIAAGEKIAVKVPSAPGRTFKLKVSDVEPEKKMVWRDGMAPMFQGVRTFTLAGRSDGTTEFRMVEVFSGLMLPMIAGQLPDFVPVFETYAKDLKNAAEKA
jgi:uncharacterized protein YndB with AHSA1/START domain